MLIVDTFTHILLPVGNSCSDRHIFDRKLSKNLLLHLGRAGCREEQEWGLVHHRTEPHNTVIVRSERLPPA
jgi:hypothetical protein